MFLSFNGLNENLIFLNKITSLFSIHELTLSYKIECLQFLGISIDRWDGAYHTKEYNKRIVRAFTLVLV